MPPVRPAFATSLWLLPIALVASHPLAATRVIDLADGADVTIHGPVTDANLTQVIRGMERNIDPGELRTQLNDRIRSIFGGNGAVLESVLFPGGPWDVPDEIGNGRPLLVVLSYEGCTVGISVDAVPDLIVRIYERKGAEGGSLRQLRNNLVFIVADESKVEDTRQKMARRLALRDLKAPERLAELAEHQQAKVKELESKSETEVAVAIQQCFRHLLYPSRNRIANASVDLAHSALDIHSASERPGAGQQQVVRALREFHKLRTQEDERKRTNVRHGVRDEPGNDAINREARERQGFAHRTVGERHDVIPEIPVAAGYEAHVGTHHQDSTSGP